jgi:integrase
VDWPSGTITYVRMKTKWRENQTPPQIRFGQAAADILNTLPKVGPLFPYLRGRLPGYRANEFRERCRGLGISGVSLHSYRYAWAERAKTVGYPERFAQWRSVTTARPSTALTRETRGSRSRHLTNTKRTRRTPG